MDTKEKIADEKLTDEELEKVAGGNVIVVDKDGNVIKDKSNESLKQKIGQQGFSEPI